MGLKGHFGASGIVRDNRTQTANVAQLPHSLASLHQ
jgi:hypothetical protein